MCYSIIHFVPWLFYKWVGVIMFTYCQIFVVCLYLGLLSYLPFCSSKFVNKEVQNSNEMLIKSVRELKRFPHLGGGFTSQYAPVWWEFAKICNDVKSNPHLGPGWGRSGFQLISALCNCSKFPRSLSNEISSCSVILSELPLFSPYFSIKSEYQNTSLFDFFLLQNTVGFENVPLSRIGLRYYSDSVTVFFDSSVRVFKRKLCHVQSRTYCHAELPAGRVHCLEMANIDPVSPFYTTLRLKKATLQWENLQKVRKTSL